MSFWPPTPPSPVKKSVLLKTLFIFFLLWHLPLEKNFIFTYAKAVLLTRALHVPVVGEDVDLFGDTGLAVTRLYRNRSSGAPGQVSGGNSHNCSGDFLLSSSILRYLVLPWVLTGWPALILVTSILALINSSLRKHTNTLLFGFFTLTFRLILLFRPETISVLPSNLEFSTKKT